MSAEFLKKAKDQKKTRRFMSKQNPLFDIFVAEERYKQQAFGGGRVTHKHSHAKTLSRTDWSNWSLFFTLLYLLVCHLLILFFYFDKMHF